MQFQFLQTCFLLKSSLLVAGKENFFLTTFLYFSWITLLKFTTNNLKPTNAKKMLVNMRKNITRSHAFAYFQNGPISKTLIETKKCITRPHAFVYFKNGPNAKNAHENEKMCSQATCLCAFQKWDEFQKRLKSTKLNKKFQNQSMSEKK